MWDSGATDIMINHNHINIYNSKLRANNVKYRPATDPYRTTHDVKVPFSMPDFSRGKTIPHNFHVDNKRGNKGIGYEIIIGC